MAFETPKNKLDDCYFHKLHGRASEMAQRIKVFVAKPKDL